MVRTHKDLHPEDGMDEDTYIRKEFFKEADSKYGVKYVEEFHYITG
jgi:hypothetical protein